MSIPKETSAPVAKSASAKKMLMGDLMQTVGILPILILIVAVFGFIAPNFFTESNLLNITRQASINIVLAANPKIDGVFAINDPTAIGADLAAKQAQRSEFFIVGVDGSPDGEEALKRKNSLFVATPAQDPQVMAAKAVEIGYDILQGKPAPTAPVLIPVTMIDKNNVSSYKGWTVK